MKIHSYSPISAKVRFRFEPPYCQLNLELDFMFSSDKALNLELNFEFGSGGSEPNCSITRCQCWYTQSKTEKQ